VLSVIASELSTPAGNPGRPAWWALCCWSALTPASARLEFARRVGGVSEAAVATPGRTTDGLCEGLGGGGNEVENDDEVDDAGGVEEEEPVTVTPPPPPPPDPDPLLIKPP